MKIAAVTVTYKRQDLLKKCIEGVISQSYGVFKLIVFDNENSLDTVRLCSEFKEVIYLGSERNIGGAGGFYEGMKYAMEHLNPDAIWIMDDDAFPTEHALKNLLCPMTEIGDQCAFTLSKVYNYDDTESLNAAPFVQRNYGMDTFSRMEDKGLLRVEAGTFVSALINATWVRKCGFPIKEFFIYYDDLEYLNRLHKNGGLGYHCRESKVYHDSKINNLVDFFLSGKPIFIFKRFLRNRAYYQWTYKGKMSLPAFFKYTLSSDFKTIAQSKKLSFQLKLRYISYLILWTVKGFIYRPNQ